MFSAVSFHWSFKNCIACPFLCSCKRGEIPVLGIRFSTHSTVQFSSVVIVMSIEFPLISIFMVNVIYKINIIAYSDRQGFEPCMNVVSLLKENTTTDGYLVSESLQSFLIVCNQ